MNKRRIGNAENLINAAAFNRINTYTKDIVQTTKLKTVFLSSVSLLHAFR